ncbi:hypothetical protein [Rhizobium oryzicola]|uniref:Flagellar hook-length control protein FliK n=1 Tax=Rhizobium oryzicola TaxID=1232668 RepID=A0ABT8SXU9_9HYPH|nr:hypothetical protein [Rhizobium oryzicola]MDO1583186.1 hypothetical protein [Rhizobium oryzicola]
MTRVENGRGTNSNHSSADGSGPYADRGGANTGLTRFGTSRGQTSSGFETRRDFREDTSDRQDREAAFSARLRHALSKQPNEGHQGDEEDAPLVPEGLSLIAAASANGRSAVTEPMEADRISPKARAERIAAQIAEALNTADRPMPGGPVTVRLQMPALDGSEIRALVLTMTGDQLDVTLTTGEHPLIDDLKLAAQALADRLSLRFPTRRIRVLEAPASRTDPVDTVEAPGVMSQISAILSR